MACVLHNYICRRVRTKLHALRECIEDLVEEVDSETNPLYREAMHHSRDYNDWNLGYRILLCSLLQVYWRLSCGIILWPNMHAYMICIILCWLLQLCYNTCKWYLVHHTTQKAVECWQKDPSAFHRDVSVMLQDSLADECHYVSCTACMIYSAHENIHETSFSQFCESIHLMKDWLGWDSYPV